MSGYMEFTSSGDWSKTEAFLREASNRAKIRSVLDKYGKMGVDALASATPSESGTTAKAWYYEVTEGDGGLSVIWRNNVMAGSTPLVILLHYGHATGTGGYVQGREFITSAIEPIFDRIEAEILKVVTTV